MKRKLAIALLMASVVIATWVWQNPIGRFGCNRFGLTVYSGIPFPVVDVVVRADGSPGVRDGKAHWVSVEEFIELIGPQADAWPDVVVIGTGYEGRVQVEEGVQTRTRPAIEVLPTPQAIELYNELRDAGKTVAAIIHSTC